MADSTEVRNLLLQINANTELLRSNLSEAERAVKAFQDSTQTHLDATDERFGLLGKSIERLEGPLERLKGLGEVALVGLFGESLLEKGKEVLEFGGNIEFMANQLGVSTDFLQKFRYAAGQFSVGTEEAQTGLGKFTRSIGEAANGNKKLIDLFDSLGVKVRDAGGNVRSTEAVYGDFANAIAKVDNPAQRVADTMAAFGRGAIGLAPLLAQGAEGFKSLASAAEYLGVVISPEMIERSEEINHKLAALKQVLNAQMASAVADNAKAIDDLATNIVKLAGALVQFNRSHPEILSSAIETYIGYKVGGPIGAAATFLGGRAMSVVHQVQNLEESKDPVVLRSRVADAQRTYDNLRKNYNQSTGSSLLSSFSQDPTDLTPDNSVVTQSALRGAFIELTKRQAALKAAVVAHSEGGEHLGSNAPGVTNDDGKATEEVQQQIADLEKLKLHATGDALTAINKELATRNRELKYLGEGANLEMARSLASGEGSAGRSAAAKAKEAAAKAESERKRKEADEASYQSELHTAQDAYAKAQLALSDTAAGRLKIEDQELQDTLAARLKQIQARENEGKYKDGEADNLRKLAIDTEQLQELEAAHKARVKVAQDALASETLDLQEKLSALGIQDRLALTAKERLKVELQILDYQERLAIKAQQGTIDTSNDPEARKRAQATIDQINADNAGNVALVHRQNEGPLDAYRTQLHGATDDMNASLQGVAVDGLKSIEDGFVGIVTGTETVASAFKKMAESIISDLARIAIEKAIVGALGSAFGGIFGGGGGGGDGGGISLRSISAHAAGGRISGPGGPRSDSILSWLSNGEYVINAEAAAKYMPMLDAMNYGRMPKFADGGPVGPMPYIPRISRADTSAIAASRGGSVQIALGDIHLSAPGADPAQLARLEDAFRRSQAELPTRVVAAVVDAKTRLTIR